MTTVKPDCSLVETATLLSEGKIGAVPVVDSKQVMVGIISERDLVRSLAEFQTGLFSKKVEDVMTSSVITCCGDDDVEDIYAQMTERRIRHMPVMQDGALVGMLSLRDFEAAYKYLQQNSVTDDLTGMVNARAFAEHLKVEFNRYRRFQFPLSVVVLKIGGYSQTLQRQGQAVCETLLKGLAESFKEQIRQFDIVGHISDDTFSVILPNTGSAAAHRACARLLKGAGAFWRQTSGRRTWRWTRTGLRGSRHPRSHVDIRACERLGDQGSGAWQRGLQSRGPGKAGSRLNANSGPEQFRQVIDAGYVLAEGVSVYGRPRTFAGDRSFRCTSKMRRW